MVRHLSRVETFCREYNKSQSLLVLNFNGIAKLFFKKKNYFKAILCLQISILMYHEEKHQFSFGRKLKMSQGSGPLNLQTLATFSFQDNFYTHEASKIISYLSENALSCTSLRHP